MAVTCFSARVDRAALKMDKEDAQTGRIRLLVFSVQDIVNLLCCNPGEVLSLCTVKFNVHDLFHIRLISNYFGI